MNANLKGLLDFFKRKNMDNIIISKEHSLSDKEARAYIKYCLSQGHTELKNCPEYEDVKDKLKIEKENKQEEKTLPRIFGLEFPKNVSFGIDPRQIDYLDNKRSQSDR